MDMVAAHRRVRSTLSNRVRCTVPAGPAREDDQLMTHLEAAAQKPRRVVVKRAAAATSASHVTERSSVQRELAQSSGPVPSVPSRDVRPGRVPGKRPGPEGGRRDENRRAKTTTLCNAALTAMLERGILFVTVDDIAAAAAVAKGSFYRYFDSKAQLVDAIISPLAEELERIAADADRVISAAMDEGELLGAYRALAYDLQRLLVAFPREVLLYLQESRGPAHGDRGPVGALSDRVARFAIVLTERAHEHGLLRPVDPRVSALAVVGAAERLLYEVLTRGALLPPEDTAQALVTIVMEGLWNPARRGT